MSIQLADARKGGRMELSIVRTWSQRELQGNTASAQ